MKKKVVLYLLLASLALPLTACGNNQQEGPVSVEEFGDVEATEKNETEEDNSEANLPTYDAQGASQPTPYTKDRKIQTKSSYYKEQLSARPRRAFDAIYAAANNRIETVEFEASQLITPSELKNIMNILFLDCPEIFWLDSSYSYEVNEDGYARKVQIYYNMSEEDVAKYQDQNATEKPRKMDYVKNDDWYSIKMVIQDIMSKNQSYQSVILTNDGYNFDCMHPFVYSGKNSIGNSKLVAYWLRQYGIECTVALGELVSDEMTNKGYEMVTDYLRFCEESQDGGTFHVKFNYSAYWMWNIVKIDDKWYAIDTTYSQLISDESKARIGKPSSYLYFVPDRTIAQTRLFYMNEEILGQAPACNDVNYMETYRSGQFILPHTETQALMRLKQIISEIVSTNATKVMYQFEDEQTFNYFVNNLDEQITIYNETYGNPIGSYKVEENRDSLMLSIYDIINNYRN